MGLQTRIITAQDGRQLRLHDAGVRGTLAPIPIFWQHGTPGTGEPPAPLLSVADELGFQMMGHDRPGYGESTRLHGRGIDHVASDIGDTADALGIARYGVIGYSGGGPHALACAATDPRVVGAVVLSGMAPRDAHGLDWYDGMIDSGRRVLRAAEQGEDARRAAEAETYDPEFLDRDLAVLDGEWEWLGRVASSFTPDDVNGTIDDDLAYVRDWNVDLTALAAPTLVIHGTEDRIVPSAHGKWLAKRIGAQLWLSEGDGHVSAIVNLPKALHWLRGQIDD